MGYLRRNWWRSCENHFINREEREAVMAMLILVGIVGMFVLLGILMVVGNAVSDWIDKKDREKHR